MGEELYAQMGFLFSQFSPIDIFVVQGCERYHFLNFRGVTGVYSFVNLLILEVSILSTNTYIIALD